jgi:hypothetical protein
MYLKRLFQDRDAADQGQGLHLAAGGVDDADNKANNGENASDDTDDLTQDRNDIDERTREREN